MMRVDHRSTGRVLATRVQPTADDHQLAATLGMIDADQSSALFTRACSAYQVIDGRVGPQRVAEPHSELVVERGFGHAAAPVSPSYPEIQAAIAVFKPNRQGRVLSR